MNIHNLAETVVLAAFIWAGGAAAQSPPPPTPATPVHTAPGEDWPSYGHDPEGTRFSPLDQINRGNVAQLKVAWTFHTGDISDGSNNRQRSGFETTPLMLDGTLYLTTAFNRIIALNPATGEQKWAYDPEIDQHWDAGDGLINRGVAAWTDPLRAAAKPCRRRIFETTIDARLVAVDAATGKPCADFGANGVVSLRDVPAYHAGWYHMTSPPAVIDDLVIVGSAIDDNAQAEMPSGVVRAFDARTGKLRWKWEPLPPNSAEAESGASRSAANRPGKMRPGRTWKTGAANAWSVMAVDPRRDLVFVPTGSASPDYFGGLRPGDDKWADSIVALHGKTGKMAWAFQLVHHDLWDYDTASPPLLADIRHNGKTLPVVIQGNKTGFVYTFNRATGEPVFSIAEKPVPQSDVPGEVTSATQPFPAAPPALSPQKMTADDIWGVTPADRDACRTMLAGLRNDGVFTPPAVKGSLAVPGNVGGMNWSGSAMDPGRGLLIVNTNNLPFKIRVISQDQFLEAARNGEHGEYTRQAGAPFAMFRTPFLSPSRLPCYAPPWASLTAVDMATGTIRWRVPLGGLRDKVPGMTADTGAIVSLGGPIVTGGGLIFIAGTFDPYIRAFDVETGKQLWEAKLPTSAHATPMTYRAADGKQYVVIASGGSAKITEEPQSDALIAFALP